MDAQATPEVATPDVATATPNDDWTLVTLATLAALWARAKPALRAAFAFGSPGNMVFAALLGAGAFLMAALAGPMDAPAEASPPPAAAPGRADPAPLPDVVALDPMSPAPVGMAPTAAIDSVLDFSVVYFWPATPQTVAEPVAIRDAPTGAARTIRALRPGERLRINGKVVDAPGGPWLRTRLADGRDGYFAARTVDVGVFRRRRPAETETVASPDDPGLAAVAGAPLIVDRTVSEESEIGPPSF